jgi:hypothetical protein
VKDNQEIGTQAEIFALIFAGTDRLDTSYGNTLLKKPTGEKRMA